MPEETGVAFQLTNILRDVKEDAERKRIYIPLDLLSEFGVSVDRVKMLANGAAMEGNERAMLRALGSQAERYYASAPRLLPLIDADSRAALWVLVTIYHRLLLKISKAHGDRIYQTDQRFDAGEVDDSHAGRFDDDAQPGGVVNSREHNDVIVVGAGAAGLAAAAALAGAGKRVTVLERKPYVGGRACSYEHPALQEVVDSQHVLLGCCTNLIELSEQAGSADEIRWYDTQTFLEPNGRSSTITTSGLPAPFHFVPSFLSMSMLGWKDKFGMAQGLMEFFRGYPAEDNESIEQWLRRTRQTGAFYQALLGIRS